MPELPEVEMVVRTLRPKLTSQRVVRVQLTRKDIVEPKDLDLASLLIGRRINHIHRRGKRILIDLDNANQFYIHLGMTGRLTMEKPDTPLRPHTHLILAMETSEMRFVDPRRFGGIFWLGTTGKIDDGLGPEPLTVRPAQLARRLAKTTRAIKSALLDQSVIAGLGNIYVDESLFAAGIHPLTRADQLSSDQIARLNRAIKLVLRRAIRHKGSTLRDYRDANGEPGSFQKVHRVYDRAGKPCWNCKTKIVRIVLGGRSTCFCPKCQTITK